MFEKCPKGRGLLKLHKWKKEPFSEKYSDATEIRTCQLCGKVEEHLQFIGYDKYYDFWTERESVVQKQKGKQT